MTNIKMQVNQAYKKVINDINILLQVTYVYKKVINDKYKYVWVT